MPSEIPPSPGPPPRPGSQLLLPPNRSVTLLLDASGALVHVVRAGAQDDDLELVPGTPIAALAPATGTDEASHTLWRSHLDALRADPYATIAFDLALPGVTPGGGRAHRLVTAIR